MCLNAMLGSDARLTAQYLVRKCFHLRLGAIERKNIIVKTCYILGTCPDPWLFNPQTLECDWAFNVQHLCFACPITVPVASLPVNGSCVQFIRCINGRATQHACQNGLHFNRETQQCDLPQNVGCTIQFTCPPNIPPYQMVAFRSETNCSE